MWHCSNKYYASRWLEPMIINVRRHLSWCHITVVTPFKSNRQNLEMWTKSRRFCLWTENHLVGRLTERLKIINEKQTNNQTNVQRTNTHNSNNLKIKPTHLYVWRAKHEHSKRWSKTRGPIEIYHQTQLSVNVLCFVSGK